MIRSFACGIQKPGVLIGDNLWMMILGVGYPLKLKVKIVCKNVSSRNMKFRLSSLVEFSK